MPPDTDVEVQDYRPIPLPPGAPTEEPDPEQFGDQQRHQEARVPDPMSLVPRIEKMMGVYQQGAMNTIQQAQQANEQEVARRRAEVEKREPMRQQLLTQMQQPTLSPEQMTDLQAPTPMPAPPPDKPVVDPEKFKEFFGIAFMMSMALGKVFRADMTQGLNALSSAITGYVQGSKEKAAADAQQYKQKVEIALNNQREKLQRYSEIIKAKQMDMQTKMNALKLEAMRDDDQQMLYALQQENYGMALKYYEKQIEQLGKVTTQAVGMWKTLETENMKTELQANALEFKREALTSLDIHRRSMEKLGIDKRGDQVENMANKALQSYEKAHRSIESGFLKSVQTAGMKAGGNKELVNAIIEQESVGVAQMMYQLNQTITAQSVNGQHFAFADERARKEMEDPAYWKAVAQGWRAVNKYVPPVVIGGGGQQTPAAAPVQNAPPPPAQTQQAPPGSKQTGKMPDGTPVYEDD